METKPQDVPGGKPRWVRRRRRRPLRRRTAIVLGVAIGLAWSVPYLMGGWGYLIEQAAINLIHGSNVEIRARKAGERLAKRRRGMTEHQLTRAFDRYVKNFKDPITKKPISGTHINSARSAFIKGYQGTKEEVGRAKR